MFDPIFQFLEKLVTDFTWKRLLFILTLSFLVVAIIITYENYTGHFRLSRIERATTLLDKLVALEDNIKKSINNDFLKIHKRLTDDLNAYINHSFTPFSLPEWVLRMFSAAVPWALLSLIFSLSDDDKTKDNTIAVLVLSSFGSRGAAGDPVVRWKNYTRTFHISKQR